MLDALLAKVCAPTLGRFVPAAAARAKSLELVSFCLGLGAAALIARHFVFAGLLLFAIARVVASLASRAAPSDVSAVFAAVAYAALPFAFVLDAPARALAAVFLMFGLAANGAAVLKLESELIGETELFVLFALTALFPDWFGPIAYVGGVLCFVATGVAAARRI